MFIETRLNAKIQSLKHLQDMLRKLALLQPRSVGTYVAFCDSQQLIVATVQYSLDHVVRKAVLAELDERSLIDDEVSLEGLLQVSEAIPLALNNALLDDMRGGLHLTVSNFVRR